MSGIYTTKIPTLDTLEDVDINPTTLANGNVIQYNSTTNEWDNVVLGNPYLLTMYSSTLSLFNLSLNIETDLPFTDVDPYGSASASDWDVPTKVWTCPVSGLYDFVLQAYGEDQTNDSITGWQSHIQHAPSGSTTFSKIAFGIIYTGDDDFASMSHNISRYYVVNAGDKIKASVTVRVNAAGGQVDFRDQKTYLQIAKLI